MMLESYSIQISTMRAFFPLARPDYASIDSHFWGDNENPCDWDADIFHFVHGFTHMDAEKNALELGMDFCGSVHGTDDLFRQ